MNNKRLKSLAHTLASHMILMVVVSSVDCASAEAIVQEDEIVEIPIGDFDRAHWAFQPLVRPVLPEKTHASDVSAGSSGEDPYLTPIDLFLQKEFVEQDLVPLPTASPEKLIRRLTLDLLGRPPTLVELEQFVQSSDPRAYERLVDRLLASPEYGIRWGQHWLDLARFAETDGFEHDKIRAEAWRYRDWVIKALNDDMPYDEFVRWQLAGDELADVDESVDAAAAQIATGFCLSGPDMPDINTVAERKHHLLNEISSTVGSVFMAMQVGCAQCHDHMYDPISQADFYRLRAFFEPSLRLVKNQSISNFAGYVEKEPESRLMVRGDWQRPGPVVSPGFLRVANLAEIEYKDQPNAPMSGRRLALAEWLVDPRNPLSARVIVNRLWHYHFGTGISRSPSDFGTMGFLPDHPELLDWLACELIDSGWSFKHIHRLIVTSSVYRRASQPTQVANEHETDTQESQDQWKHIVEVDPENILLARFPRQRLNGEALRDSMLQLAGDQNDQMGGPGIRPPLPQELTSTLLNKQWEVTPETDQHFRRSIYIFVRRNLTYPIFDAFDRPSANTSCARRNESTTAVQSLYLLNSEFSDTIAERWSSRLISEEPNWQPRIDRAFLMAFSRRPLPKESSLMQTFVNDPSWIAAADGDEVKSERLAWKALCLAILNANEFIYAD